jgi:hypothetical protein
MNGKAATCFLMAGLCVTGAIGYIRDGIKAMDSNDPWRDAVRYSPNGTATTAEPAEDAKAG